MAYARVSYDPTQRRRFGHCFEGSLASTVCCEGKLCVSSSNKLSTNRQTEDNVIYNCIMPDREKVRRSHPTTTTSNPEPSLVFPFRYKAMEDFFTEDIESILYVAREISGTSELFLLTVETALINQ